jgi:hypothetical protein
MTNVAIGRAGVTVQSPRATTATIIAATAVLVIPETKKLASAMSLHPSPVVPIKRIEVAKT